MTCRCVGAYRDLVQTRANELRGYKKHNLRKARETRREGKNEEEGLM